MKTKNQNPLSQEEQLKLRRRFADAIANRDLKLVSSILDSQGGVDLANLPASDDREERCWKPLVRAASNGDIPMAQVLLEAGAILQDGDVLKEVVGRNNIDFLRFLKTKGFDFPSKNSDEFTAVIRNAGNSIASTKIKDFLLQQGNNGVVKAKNTLIIFNFNPEESDTLKIELGEVFAMDNVTHIENPENISDLENSLKTHGDKFDRVFVKTHGGFGDRISTIHLTQDEGDLYVEISDAIKILNEKNNAKEIHVFSCHGGAHFGEEEAIEKLQKATKPGQVIVQHSDDKASLKDLDNLRTKSAAKNNLSPIANAILISPEAINVFVRSQSGYSTFSHEIFSRNPELEISTANLRKYLEDSVFRAQKFEVENGIKRDLEIDQKLKNLTTEENLQKYLSRLLTLSIGKISTPEEELEFIAQWGKEEVMKIVDINFSEEGSDRALSIAVLGGWAKVVNFILESGKANVNAVNGDGTEALSIAAQKDDDEIVANLLKHGANPNTTKTLGGTPYHVAAQLGNTEVLKVFYERGVAYPNTKDDNGITAIFRALDNKHYETFLYILETNNNRDPNITQPEGNTLLNMAANKAAWNKDYIRFVEPLLKAGDSPNIPDNKGWTVLMNLATTGDVKIVKLAIDHGADLWAKNSEGKTALEIVKDNGKSEVAALLQKQEKLQRDLAAAVDSKNLESVKNLINLGANPSLPQSGDLEERFWTPLDRAAHYKNMPMVKLLLENGAKPKDQEAFERIAERGSDVGLFGEINHVLELPLAYTTYKYQKTMKTLIVINFPKEDGSSKFKKKFADELKRGDVIFIENPVSEDDFKNKLEPYQGKFDRAVVNTHGNKMDIPVMFVFGGDFPAITDVIKMINKGNEKTLKKIHLSACKIGVNFEKIAQKDASNRYYKELDESLIDGQILFLHGDTYTGDVTKSLDQRLKGIVENKDYSPSEAVLDSSEAVAVVIKNNRNPTEPALLETFSYQPFARNRKAEELTTANLRTYLNEVVQEARSFEEAQKILNGDASKQRLENLSEEDLQADWSKRLSREVKKAIDAKEPKRIEFLRTIENLNFVNEDGWTVLMLAVEGGDTEMVKLLLENKQIDPNLADKDGWTALMLAAVKGHTEDLKLLLENEKTNPNLADERGFTALMFAVDKGHAETVKPLLENEETNPNLVNKDGWTALMSAADKGHTEIVKSILENEKTNPNLVNNDGWAALILAANKGHTKIVELLLENEKTNPNLAQENGLTALMYAAGQGHAEVVKLLLKNKQIDPNHADENGKTALEIAKDRGNSEMIKILQNQEQLQSQLVVAVSSGNLEKAENLINRGANPNLPASGAPKERVWTPLDRAAAQKNAPMMKLLLENGAKPKDQEAFERIVERAGDGAGDFVNKLNPVLELLVALTTYKYGRPPVPIDFKVTGPTTPPSANDDHWCKYLPTPSATPTLSETPSFDSPSLSWPPAEDWHKHLPTAPETPSFDYPPLLPEVTEGEYKFTAGGVDYVLQYPKESNDSPAPATEVNPTKTQKVSKKSTKETGGKTT